MDEPDMMDEDVNIPPNEAFLYLPPEGNQLLRYSVQNPPPLAEGLTRVVCISDTHCEQRHLNLPWGHMLVHAGDVLTESGLRHLHDREKDSLFLTVKSTGVNLFETFAAWFGGLPHPHKVLIAGNHDWVLQALGTAEVTKTLEKYCVAGSTVYLDHGEASVGPVKVFGSPYGHWGSHNNAFMSKDCTYDNVTKNTHIMVTHYPAILPKSEGRLREDDDIIHALHRCGGLLHVGGHCHWAHGLYFTKKKHTPCVVASVCDSKWINPVKLLFSTRGDQEGDRWRGGYDIYFPPIVCDLRVPGGPPKKTDVWTAPINKPPTICTPPFVNPQVVATKPSLIFFGPNTDPGAVKRLFPEFCVLFQAYHFDDVEEACTAVHEAEKSPFTVCVAKLGSSRNHCGDLLKLLHDSSPNTWIAVHSSTALRYKDTQKSYKESYGVKLFIDHTSEKLLFEQLKEIAQNYYLKQ